MEAVRIIILIDESLVTTMCTDACTIDGEDDRTTIIEAFDDIFSKIRKKIIFVIRINNQIVID